VKVSKPAAPKGPKLYAGGNLAAHLQQVCLETEVEQEYIDDNPYFIRSKITEIDNSID
jgi:hypothetical protein